MESNQNPQDLGMLNEMIERESAIVNLLAQEMNKVIVGQKHMIERLLIGLLSQYLSTQRNLPPMKTSTLIRAKRLMTCKRWPAVLPIASTRRPPVKSILRDLPPPFTCRGRPWGLRPTIGRISLAASLLWLPNYLPKAKPM